MKKNNPIVSVIIPIYNAEKYISQTLDCVCHQTYKDLEIICVLDGPPDNSAHVTKEYAKSDKRIIVLEQPKNMGMSAARNLGVRKSKGEFIHFMDADDLINMEFYEKLVDAIQISDADTAVCDMIHERLPYRGLFNSERIVSSNPQDKYDHLSLSSPTANSACRYMFRRSFWIKNKIHFPEDMLSIEDATTTMPAIMKTNRVVQVPGATYVYKNRPSSIMTRKDKSFTKIRDKNTEIAGQIKLKTMADYGIVEKKPRVIKQIRYRDPLINRTLFKKVYYSDNRVFIYLFGIKILKIG